MDATHPSHLGIMPETGALAGALKTAGGSDPIAIGKPEPFLFDIAVGILNILPENILMIGDNPYTDIMGGSAAGMKTALLCLEGIPVSHQADVAFHRFSELKKIFFTKEDDSNAEQKPCGTAPSAQT
jgi:ribonucleotide monophosphatase NagD (HAD superfamily)